ncbi:MAG: sigma 54-interacting transcriptional regulator [Acidobacteriota bacterium]
MALCLIIEDDAPQRSVLSATLEAEGYQVVEAENGAIARELCSKRVPELILLDLGLPDTDGLKLIPDLRVSSPLSRIVVLTGRNSVADAVTALRTGARHYLLKPWDLEELLLVVEREIRAVDFAEAQQRCDDSNIAWGSHPGMTRLRTQLGKLSLSPMTPVLIEGETGSGKEVMARELHRMSASDGPFVAMNCASIPSGLMESELFGHERGAFTSADRRRRGLAELARNGTLFLDEIGEMAPALQAKLLRFLQDFRFRRVGGEEELESRCRIIAATHRNLEEMER